MPARAARCLSGVRTAMGKRAIAAGGLLLAVVVAVAVALGGRTSTPGALSPPRAPAPSVPAATLPAPTVTTSTPAPHMRATHRVVADGLAWRIRSSTTTHVIQNEYLPATATGVYLVLDVAATNDGERALVLDPSQLRLELAGSSYAVSASALTALELAGRVTFPATTLAPGASAAGTLVFDVPPAAAGAAPELCLESVSCGT
jgi:hypothetical protein